MDLGGFGGVAAVGVGLAGVVVGEVEPVDELEFVVGEILFGEVGALFEKDDGEAGFGELFGDNGASGANGFAIYQNGVEVGLKFFF